PTLLDLCGLPIPAGLDGRSLLGTLEREPESRDVYLETHLPYEDYGWSPLFAMVKNRWKYIEAPKPELYHLVPDPGEGNDLARIQHPTATSMESALLKLANRRSPGVERVPVDGVSLASLMAVGYVSGRGMAREGESLPDPKDLIDIPGKLEQVRTVLFARGPKERLQGVILLEEILKRNPGNGDALRLLCYEALRFAKDPRDPNKTRYLAAARRGFSLWAERAPKSPDPEYGLGLITLSEANLAQARYHFQEVRRKFPEHVRSVTALMQMAYQEHDLASARELAEEALARDPEDPETTLQVGMVRRECGDLRGAIALFQKLLPGRDLDEGQYLYFLLGESYRALEEYQKALDSYRKVTHPLIRRQRNVEALQAECRRRLQ
ncbi:MAG: tetratricopeptide repeat protein, partial [Planctomycetota bacterium]